jgi:hypothetical protein
MATIAAALALLAAPAQDFGVDWLDRVSHELREARPPLTNRPVQSRTEIGGLYYYDTNIFLESSDEESDSVAVGFVRGRMDYAEVQMDAALDFLLSYKRYLDEEDETDFEQRLFGRARYAGAQLQAEVAEVLRHESDPIDSVFAERAERWVSDTVPRLFYDFNNLFAAEAAGNIEVVRFEDDPFDDSDNVNIRADASLVYLGAGGIDFLGQAGWISIDYDSRSAVDADGSYARGGLRGDLSPQLLVEALGGWTKVTSDDLPSGENEEHSTGDAIVRVRYLAMDTLTLWGDYLRMITWAGGRDPFQVVNRWVGIVEWQYTDQIGLRARGQYDRADTALGLERTFWSASAGGTYRFREGVVLDVGITWRAGEVRDVPGGDDFDGMIFHAGLVATN